MPKRAAACVLKRPAAKSGVFKRPAAHATEAGRPRRSMKRPAISDKVEAAKAIYSERRWANMSQATWKLRKKLELVLDIIDEEAGIHPAQVEDLPQLYHDAACAAPLRARFQFQVLDAALRLATECGEFLGKGLMCKVLDDMDENLDLNLLDSSGHSIFLKSCEGRSDAAGTLVNWEPICLLAAHPRFACLDLLPDVHTMYITCGNRSCLDENVLLELLRRNRASGNCKVRATVNHISCTWSEEQTLLQLICGARSDSLTERDYSNFEQFLEEANATQNFEVLNPRDLPLINRLQGSPAVAKALLEHPDFTATNFMGGCRCTALHILLSTSGDVPGAPVGRTRKGFGYLSHRHLPWDAKVATVKVFMAHAKLHPDQVDFKLRNEPGRYGDKGCWLPAELARLSGFPEDVTQRLETLTLFGVPSRVLRVPQLVKTILQFM